MKKYFLTPIASAVIIICFFSPWISCGSLTISGYDIASGSERGESVSTDSASGSAILWAVPISAIIIAAVYMSKKSFGKVTILIASFLSLFVMALKGLDVKDKWSDSAHILWGFWVTVAAFIICILGAFNTDDE